MAKTILRKFAGLRADESVLILAETESSGGMKAAFFRAARDGAVTHPGGAKETHCYADI